MAKKKARRSNTRMSDITPESVSRGKAYVDEFLKQYGDVPLSQIAGVESVEPVSETWEDRPKSNIVKWLMDKSGRSLEEVAESLGCTTSYLNNKLHRDSFSLDDMISSLREAFISHESILIPLSLIGIAGGLVLGWYFMLRHYRTHGDVNEKAENGILFSLRRQKGGETS